MFKPLIEEEELAAVAEALEMGWLGMGSYVEAFERRLETLIETEDRHVAALSTGHAALHLALAVAGVGLGDEVITPSLNNVTDFQAILAVGAEPVLCDIDPVTLCIDVEKAGELVGPRTRAVIATDYACMLCDHEALQALADRHGLRVVHDAAHSLGSRHQGRMVGSFSDICMFSFDPVKLITAIDGGALVLRSDEELAAVREMRFVGMQQPAEVAYGNRRAWTQDVARLGFRYHLSNPHAALALAQLGKIDHMVESRRATCRRLAAGLSDCPQVVVPATDFANVAPLLFYIRVPPACRAPLREHLRERGIDSGLHWQPGHSFSLLESSRRGDLSVTDRVAQEIVSLPLHSGMPNEAVDLVTTAVGEFFETDREGDPAGSVWS